MSKSLNLIGTFESVEATPEQVKEFLARTGKDKPSVAFRFAHSFAEYYDITPYWGFDKVFYKSDDLNKVLGLVNKALSKVKE